MAKQKTWRTESEILTAIDETLKRAEDLDRQALLLQSTCVERAKKGVPREEWEDWQYSNAEWKKMKRQASRLRDKRLVVLKNTLAAFKTEPMAFLSDRSVVTQ